jgi:hypothetical protein
MKVRVPTYSERAPADNRIGTVIAEHLSLGAFDKETGDALVMYRVKLDGGGPVISFLAADCTILSE